MVQDKMLTDIFTNFSDNIEQDVVLKDTLRKKKQKNADIYSDQLSECSTRGNQTYFPF